MSELFSSDWMSSYQEFWNAEPELSGALGKINFNSVIGYGFKGEAEPKGVLIVENGRVETAGPFVGQALNWDLRADPATWKSWQENPPGMMGLGMAYASSQLQFVIGDYAAMIKDPQMAGPFIKSFAIMAQLA